MAALLNQYFYIAFLMGKPQDLPAGENQMVTGVALYFVTSVLALVSYASFGSAVMRTAVDLGCTGLFLYMALMLVKRLPRFEQAFGGLCGAGAILNLIAVPILHLTTVSGGEAIGPLAFFAYIFLLVWSLSLVALVLRHTFSLPMVVSTIISVAYYVLIANLLAQVFPAESEIEQVSMLLLNVGQALSVG